MTDRAKEHIDILTKSVLRSGQNSKEFNFHAAMETGSQCRRPVYNSTDTLPPTAC